MPFGPYHDKKIATDSRSRGRFGEALLTLYNYFFKEGTIRINVDTIFIIFQFVFEQNSGK